MSVTCPFCDSSNVEMMEVNESFTVPFCENAIVSHQMYRCNDCEEEGDFEFNLGKVLTKTLNRINNASAPKLMDDLAQIGVTMTYLEKALRLPFRTTARWRRGALSHSSLALLRLIRFSPALLEVADDNFSDVAMAKYQVFRSWDFFKSNTTNPTCAVKFEQNELGLAFTGTISPIAVSSGGRDVKWEQLSGEDK